MLTDEMAEARIDQIALSLGYTMLGAFCAGTAGDKFSPLILDKISSLSKNMDKKTRFITLQLISHYKNLLKGT